jgi:hypothetical protein
MTANRWIKEVLLVLILVSGVSVVEGRTLASKKGEPKKANGRSSVPQNYKPSTIAEIPEKKKLKNLKSHFMPLWKHDRTASKVKIKSGPMRNVKLSGNKVGSKWIAQAGKYEIELFVENGSIRTIDTLLDALRCLPDPLLWGLSEATLNGVQIHKKIGAAAYASGHGVLLAQHAWDGMATLLLHEAGHVIYNVTNDRTEINQEDEWLKAMAADDISMSAYGDGRWGEDVAEFGQIYFVSLLAGSKKHKRFNNRTALQELERLSPQRFAAWKVLLRRPLGYSQPIAVASNQTFKDTDDNGSEMATLDGSKSKDKDGKIVKYDWYEKGRKIASGRSPKVKLRVGAHDIILVVTDNKGYVDDRSFIVTVVDAKSAKAVALTIVAVKASKSPGDHTKEHTIDNKLATLWSVNGRGNWLQYDLGKAKTVSGVSIAWFSGISRTYSFSVEVSKDGVSWSKAYSGKSTKTTNEQEHYRFTPVKARYVKLIGQGSSANAWNNIAEFDAWGTGK